jgi:hypothetical protein
MYKENNFFDDAKQAAGTMGPLLVAIPILNAGMLGHGIIAFTIMGVTVVHGYFAQISNDNLWFARRTIWSGKGIWVRVFPELTPPPLLWEHSNITGSEQ